jgi:hypothetical protein
MRYVHTLSKEQKYSLSFQFEINQIKVGFLSGNLPILIAVNDGGRVKIFFVDDLERRPITLL